MTASDPYPTNKTIFYENLEWMQLVSSTQPLLQIRRVVGTTVTSNLV